MWRVIPPSTHSGAMNMAIDEAIAEHVAAGGQPTIRFYQWNPKTITIGYFQNAKKEVNFDACNNAGVDVVRRRTGGGAVYHDKELTYSIIGKESLFPKGITESYEAICSSIIKGLEELGIHSTFSPINDVLIEGKKVSGNAQTRRGGVLQQHGTILHEVDVDTMFKLLNVSDIKIRDKIIKNVKERVTCVNAWKQVDFEELYQAILKGFTHDKSWAFGELSEEEIARAQELVHTRYGAQSWLLER